MDKNNGEKTLESMSQAVWYNQWTLNKFKEFISGDILEVGCGIGNFTDTLSKLGKVTAIDIERSYLNERNFSDGTKIGFGDIEKGEYFFESKKFDTIVCLNVLEHIEDDKKALDNLYNLLKDEGKLIVLVPSHPNLYGEIDRSIGHFRRYTKKDLLQKMKDADFFILKSRRLNMLGAVGWWVAGRFFKERIVGNGKIKIFNFIAPFILPIENIIEFPFGTSILVVAKK